jgi:hypothetical protein
LARSHRDHPSAYTYLFISFRFPFPFQLLFLRYVFTPFLPALVSPPDGRFDRNATTSSPVARRQTDITGCSARVSPLARAYGVLLLRVRTVAETVESYERVTSARRSKAEKKKINNSAGARFEANRVPTELACAGNRYASSERGFNAATDNNDV